MMHLINSKDTPFDHLHLLYYSPAPNLTLNSNTGFGTHMRKMIEAFTKMGTNVTPHIMGSLEDSNKGNQENIFTKNFKESLKSCISPRIWETMKDALLLSKDKRYLQSLNRKIKEIQPDLIYERGNYLQLSGVRAAQNNEIYHILEMNAPDLEEKRKLGTTNSFLKKYAKKIEKQQLENTDLIVVDTNQLKYYYQQEHNIDENKFVVVPMAVDPNEIQVDKNRIKNIYKEYGLQNKFIIGYVGSIFEWNSLDILLRAYSHIKHHEYDVKILIVGGGRILKDLKELCSQLKLEEEVIFTDWVPHEDVYNFIEIMDIAVLPNFNWWASPIKIFEYGALGKPIIAPKTSPICDVMKNEQDGILIEPSEEKLAAAIQTIMDNPEHGKQMGINFQKKVLTKYTWSKNAERILSRIQNLSLT